MKLTATFFCLFLWGITTAQGEYDLLNLTPIERLTYISELYYDALDPYRHLSESEKTMRKHLQTGGQAPFDSIWLVITNKLYTYLHYAGGETPNRLTESEEFDIKEYYMDELHIKWYTIYGEGKMIELFDGQGRIIVFYRFGIKYDDIDHWPGLKPGVNDTYFDESDNSMHVFEYNELGQLTHVVQYHSSESDIRFHCYFEDDRNPKSPPPITLLEHEAVSAAAFTAPKGIEEAIRQSSEGFQPSIQFMDCNHGHICCQSGCRCCPDKFRMLPMSTAIPPMDIEVLPIATAEAPKEAPKPTTPIDYTKILEGGVTLRVFPNENPSYHPLYEFTDARGNVKKYYSTLTTQAFIAASKGESRYNEYNSSGEAWVLRENQQTFCKIDRQGREVLVQIDSEYLGTANIPNSLIREGVYSAMLPLHEHLPDIKDSENDRIELVALVNTAGEVIEGFWAGSIRSMGSNRIKLTSYPNWLGVGEETLPEIKYELYDTELKKIGDRVYNEMGNFIEGLALVSDERGYGYIDRNGKEVIQPQYTDAKDFNRKMMKGNFFEGKAIVCLKGCGVINTEGEVVVPLDYLRFEGFSEGLCAVKKAEGCGYIDTTGRLVIPCIFGTANYFSKGKALVFKKNDKGETEGFYIDTKGNRLEGEK